MSDQLSTDTVLALLHAATPDSTSDDELERVLRSEGLSDGRHEEIVRSLRRIQGSYAHLQRRTRELAALFSTARELVQLHDVDTVLQRLVERAHDLIGTEVTYLSEVVDDLGGMSVRYSVGTVSASFKDLFVPSGMGLASKVVEARRPVWVSRYSEMSEAPHDPGIDDAVSAEGLVSFLGVPLVVGNEVLGALFACNRFAHDFTPEQVSLLAAFADHAASVLNSARLLRRSDEAVEEAGRAYAVLQEHLAGVERASLVHERLTSVVVSGGGIADIAATLADALSRPVMVLDAQLHRLAGHPADHPPPPSGPLVLDGVARSRSTGLCVDIDVDGSTWTVVALAGAETLLGVIAASVGSQAFDDGDRRMLERAAHMAALLSLKRDAVETAAAERRSRILVDLITGVDVGAADPTGELDAMGQPVRWVAVMELPDGGSTTVYRSVVRHVGDRGLFLVRGRRLVLAWTGDDDGAARTEMLRESLEALTRRRLTAVVAPVPEPLSELAQIVERAEGALSLMPSLGVEGTTVAADAYAPYLGIVPTDRGAASQFVDELLGPVIRWDLRRKTDLVVTLASYFGTGESASATARVLHVHKNTVQQRLERIQELTTGEWTDPEFRFRLHAAVRLHALRTSRTDTTDDRLDSAPEQGTAHTGRR